MTRYMPRRSHQTDPSEEVVATHPCQDGTIIVWVGSSRECRCEERVVLWGVLRDCRLVPITIQGIWSGTEESRGYIRFPDGRCARDSEFWDTEDEALRRIAEAG